MAVSSCSAGVWLNDVNAEKKLGWEALLNHEKKCYSKYLKKLVAEANELHQEHTAAWVRDFEYMSAHKNDRTEYGNSLRKSMNEKWKAWVWKNERDLWRIWRQTERLVNLMRVLFHEEYGVWPSDEDNELYREVCRWMGPYKVEYDSEEDVEMANLG
jgi:hypothetical protein